MHGDVIVEGLMEGSEITEQVAGKVVVDDDLLLKRNFLLPVLLVALGKESLNSYLQKVLLLRLGLEIWTRLRPYFPPPILLFNL
ncbi:hypothetical protein TSUD_135080 [Trifolium subterraneum]|uniref:Uncharacterized protein n=1 Tax=Trifolium subterraneum TaxID=3900 RepID=A0A2Z6NXQ7_TRISU|nr:hypothetical protein TSUD_135080 [Trifolium subterraneum]